MKNIDRSTMTKAIIAAGYIIHPCNEMDSAPIDENAIYYLSIDELYGLYIDCI